MSTQSKSVVGALLTLLAAPVVVAQSDSLSVDFPPESPVAVVSIDMGSMRAEPRGGAQLVDLHTSLRLRNSSQGRIRGITLLVLAQEVTAGGKASVSVPSLDAGPGEVFPVRIDLRLLRPLQAGGGPLATVNLDGVLFDDLSFFGPDRLNSRRSMTVWELEARRDREYFKSILEAQGSEGLQEEILVSLARQADMPRLGVEVARSGRATNLEAAREFQFAFLQFAGAPVEPVSGSARFTGQEAAAPSIEVRNRSGRRVKYVEIGWIVGDGQGRRFLAGSVPAEVDLAPGRTSHVATQTALRFAKPLAVESTAGYVSKVEFADGEVWIPSREELSDGGLDTLLAPSPEEQRLTNIYRKRGLKALIAELDRF